MKQNLYAEWNLEIKFLSLNSSWCEPNVNKLDRISKEVFFSF